MFFPPETSPKLYQFQRPSISLFNYKQPSLNKIIQQEYTNLYQSSLYCKSDKFIYILQIQHFHSIPHQHQGKTEKYLQNILNKKLNSIITWIDRFLLIMRATKLLGFGDMKKKSTNCQLPFYLFLINFSLL